MIGLGSAGLFNKPSSGGGGGGAPTASSYIVIGADGTLTNERVLVGTAAQVILTDGGAGGNITLSLPQDIDLTSSPTFAQLTLEDGVLQSNLDLNVTGVDSASLFTFQPDPVGAAALTITATGVITPALNIVGTTSAPQITLDGDTTQQIRLTTYSDTLNPAHQFRHARGSAAAARRLNTGDALGTVQWQGGFAADDSSAASFSGNSATLQVVALENFTSTAKGTQFNFNTAAIGATAVATRASLTATAFTLGSGVDIVNSTGQNLRPDGESGTYGYFRFINAVNPGSPIPSGGTGVNQLWMHMYSRTDTASYFNPVISFRAFDGTNEEGAYELGVEGGWTTGGGFTVDKRVYLWDYQANSGAGGNIWYFDYFSPTEFHVGGSGNRMDIDMPYGNANTGWYSNDATAPQFLGRKYRGVYATGRRAQSGDTLVTFDGAGGLAADDSSLPDLDGAASGRMMFLATQSHTASAKGTSWAVQTTADGSTTLVTRLALSQDGQLSNTVEGAFNPTFTRLSNNAAGMSVATVKGRGDRTAPRRVQSGDVLGGINMFGHEAVDDSTNSTASTSLVGANLRGVALEAFTSTAHGSYVQVQTASTGGTTANTKLAVSVEKALTNNSATNIISATIASGSAIGGTIRYVIEVTNGTDYQVETGYVTYTAANKAGTVTATATEHDSQQTVTSGTLATTWAISAASPAVISVNANSSLTPSGGYPRITFSMENHGRQAIAFV